MMSFALYIVMLNAVMVSVIMLSVVAPIGNKYFPALEHNPLSLTKYYARVYFFHFWGIYVILWPRAPCHKTFLRLPEWTTFRGPML
jgi:hypothetical protein